MKYWRLSLVAAAITLISLIAIWSTRCIPNASPNTDRLYLRYVPRTKSYDIMDFSKIENYALTNYALQKISENLIETDFKEFSRRVRLYKQVYNKVHLSQLGQILEGQLFPFLKSTSLRPAEVLGNGQPGIVLTTGNLYFPFAVHVVRALRHLNCSLQIEIWYYGNDDLDPKNVSFLRGFHNVEVRDLQQYFHTKLVSWDCKPFAMLASRFSQVLLMDADAVFMQNPEILFSDEGYLETGALFFKDRSLFPYQYDKAKWIVDLFPEPVSERIQDLRMLQARSQYEQESGVVLIDKRRHLIGILATCALNWPGPMKNIIRENTHGEKETFWIGLEMANERYSFSPNLPGSIGQIDYNNEDEVHEICGKLAHFGRDGRILWFNDAIATSKFEGDPAMEDVSVLTHFAIEGECQWENLCMRGGPFYELNALEVNTLHSLREIYRFDPHNKVIEMPEE